LWCRCKPSCLAYQVLLLDTQSAAAAPAPKKSNSLLDLDAIFAAPAPGSGRVLGRVLCDVVLHPASNVTAGARLRCVGHSGGNAFETSWGNDFTSSGKWCVLKREGVVCVDRTTLTCFVTLAPIPCYISSCTHCCIGYSLPQHQARSSTSQGAVW